MKILAQTVDELGYRLGHQSLVFIDETGLESHVSSDDKGVFDGYVQVRGSGLSVRSPDGITPRVRDGAFSQPALIDVVIRSDQRTATALSAHLAVVLVRGSPGDSDGLGQLAGRRVQRHVPAAPRLHIGAVHPACCCVRAAGWL